VKKQQNVKKSETKRTKTKTYYYTYY